tara:strand:- start:289 stop:831 length:543 start_codon:yes stop_codon:yes gene_type:complete
MSNKVSTRIVFETDKDLERQQTLINLWSTSCQENLDFPFNPYDPKKRGEHFLRVMPMPYKYRIDYLLTTDYGKAVGLAEVKWYFSDWQTKNGEILLSLMKVRDLMSFADTIGCKPYFVIRLQSGGYYFYLEKEFIKRSKIVMSGRYDRGEQGDIEPMVAVPERYWNIFHLGNIDMSPDNV